VGDAGVWHDAERRVVWVRGEQDSSTVVTLSVAIARAMTTHDDDVVLDLSAVDFIDAATVGLIVRTRELLQEESRRLVLRSPSLRARRVFELCGLDTDADGAVLGTSDAGREGDLLTAGTAQRGL
jgi:anti-anti-sigma factor